MALWKIPMKTTLESNNTVWLQVVCLFLILSLFLSFYKCSICSVFLQVYFSQGLFCLLPFQLPLLLCKTIYTSAQLEWLITGSQATLALVTSLRCSIHFMRTEAEWHDHDDTFGVSHMKALNQKHTTKYDRSELILKIAAWLGILTWVPTRAAWP